MTRALRRTHFVAWLVLGPGALCVLILALSARARAGSHLPGRVPTAREAHP